MYKKGITLKKMIEQGAMVFIAGGITELLAYVQTIQDPMTETFSWMLFVVLLKGIENYLKHRND